MLNRGFARGVFLVALSLAFGLGAFRYYSIGTLVRPGPGLFPLLVSGLLLVLALATIVQSQIVAAVPLQFNVTNIAVIMLGLGAFVVLSKFVSMIAGIVAMVFIASLAASSYSWRRNLMISAALVAIAFGFQVFLGLNLRLV